MNSVDIDFDIDFEEDELYLDDTIIFPDGTSGSLYGEFEMSPELLQTMHVV